MHATLSLQSVAGWVQPPPAVQMSVLHGLASVHNVVDTVHVLLFILFSGFIIVHVYLASLGHTPSAHFKAMITGYEEVEDEPIHEPSA